MPLLLRLLLLQLLRLRLLLLLLEPWLKLLLLLIRLWFKRLLDCALNSLIELIVVLLMIFFVKFVLVYIWNIFRNLAQSSDFRDHAFANQNKLGE